MVSDRLQKGKAVVWIVSFMVVVKVGWGFWLQMYWSDKGLVWYPSQLLTMSSALYPIYIY